jgi:hypothetical protein
MAAESDLNNMPVGLWFAEGPSPASVRVTLENLSQPAKHSGRRDKRGGMDGLDAAKPKIL